MSEKAYSLITATILSELERGVIPWRQPWTPELAPQNFVSGKAHRGINALLLCISSQDYQCPFFATQRQIRELGGRVHSDQINEPDLFSVRMWVPDEAEETGDTRLKPILCFCPVWNLAQTKGITWSLPERDQNNPVEECERIVHGYSDGPSIHYEKSPFTYYSMLDDSVHIPTEARSGDPYAHYQVLFHELVHSTGHASRLKRDLSSHRDSRVYAREQLTAEIGAAFLLGSAGLTESAPIPKSVAYIFKWMRTLKDDPRCVVCAASRAQRAADWILGKRQSERSGEQSDVSA